ncbi:608_t:CDS:1, partial [Paraglomus occultum]
MAPRGNKCVKRATIREVQENAPLVNDHITINEQISDNHYDENELNYANLWDKLVPA